LYSEACPHFGHVRVCVRASVVSLKNSRSSILFRYLHNRQKARRKIPEFRSPCVEIQTDKRPGPSAFAQTIPYSSLP
jgi:hypothetical protein